MNKKILIVEGESDKKFFESFIKKTQLEIGIQVDTPLSLGAGKDGKTAGFKLLPQLLKQLVDGRVTHLAMVVDADMRNDNWGYENTVKLIAEKISDSGYNDRPDRYDTGLSFPHSDGLNNFGLWVMPDNRSEGMLEDWIRTAIATKESSLLNIAIDTVSRLPKPTKFNQRHTSKANIATWMAWQKIPGKGLEAVIDDELINMNSESVANFLSWLKHTYSDH